MKAIKVKIWHLILFQSILVLLSITINSLWLKKNLSSLLLNDFSLFYQIIIGSLTGFSASAIILLSLKILRSKITLLNHLRTLYESRVTLIMFTCIITGFSEELFFRVIIQSTTGLVLASLAFTIAHSQFWAVPPINLGKIVFGSVILLMGCIFGTLYNSLGYVCATSSHIFFDFVLLIGIKYFLIPKNTNIVQ